MRGKDVGTSTVSDQIPHDWNYSVLTNNEMHVTLVWQHRSYMCSSKNRMTSEPQITEIKVTCCMSVTTVKIASDNYEIYSPTLRLSSVENGVVLDGRFISEVIY